MTEAGILIFMFVLIAVGMPIAFSILGAALLGVFMLNGELGFLNAALSLYDGATSFPLIAIPLFILAGALMNTGGISTRLIAFVSAMIGFVRGGLAMVNVGVSMFFAEISGSAVADVAATGSVLIPAMKQKGYSPRLAAAITSSSASLAIIIPPSIPMILYGAMSDTSVVKLFVAGIVPGVLGGGLLMALCYYMARRYDLPRDEAFSLRRLGETAKEASWALILPVVILGGIFGGVVTATEGAAIAVVAALFIGVFIYREIDLRHLYRALVDGVLQTSVVMLMVAASAVLGLYLTETEMPQRLAAGITQITTNPLAVLMIINLFLLFVGMVLHGAAAIILTVPVFMPLVHELGIDPIQFGILLTLNIALGQQTPPVASVLITSCSIARTDVWRTSVTNLPFVGVLVLVLLLVTYVPAVSLSLVDLVYGQ
ncbi:TRAP transporter large permease [Salipiger sp. H15]|uniref:TRAP transporter large permease protein n=1 Tax=Alloyangia sp. H15 TaxID=3029062 RepID=A0AAU8AK80_9RHOB